MAVLYKRVSQYRSSLYETARGILRSRNRQAEINQELSEKIRELETRAEKISSELQSSQEQLALAQQEVETQRLENQQLRQQPIRLPSDLPMPHHPA